MSFSIEISNLSKEFISARTLHQLAFHPFRREKNILAVDNISLRIKKGEILALAGPNGAGKTSLIKILSCLILPTRGRAMVAGYDILKEEQKVKDSIGLVGWDERSFYWRLTLRQNLYFFAILYNLSDIEAKKRIEELASLLKITAQLDNRFQECSAGIKQRLAIARSMLNDPEILFMDEPTKSLDPSASKSLRDFIKERLVGKQQKTIVFATHNLYEVENFVDQIAIMHSGRIKACGTLSELRDKAGLPHASMEDIYDRVINHQDG